MATILGIESTCDETAASVVVDGYDVRSNVVATQVELHAKYRGVVPEIASRAHIENILPVVREAVGRVGATPASPDLAEMTSEIGDAGVAPTTSREPFEPRATHASPLQIDAVAVAH